MSYTTKIKDEIIDVNPTKAEKVALLSGFIRNNGEINNNRLLLATENKLTETFIKNLIKEIIDINIITEIKSNVNFSKKELLVLTIDNPNKLLEEIGYLGDDLEYLTTPPEYIIDDNSLIRNYLKGVFLCVGSINDPKTARYHMELLIEQKEESVFVQKLLNLFSLNAKILTRNKGYMIYLKDADGISDFLKIIGASNAVMYFEDIRIYHDKKNHTNRLNNCEQANTDKVVEAATKEIEDIEVLQENLAVNLLDDKTKEALEYRLKYPEASLKELSEIISMETNKKITKSGLYHRFRKIKKLANKFKSKKTIIN